MLGVRFTECPTACLSEKLTYMKSATTQEFVEVNTKPNSCRRRLAPGHMLVIPPGYLVVCAVTSQSSGLRFGTLLEPSKEALTTMASILAALRVHDDGIMQDAVHTAWHQYHNAGIVGDLCCPSAAGRVMQPSNPHEEGIVNRLTNHCCVMR